MLALIVVLFLLATPLPAASPVYPEPQEIQLLAGRFPLDEQVVVIVPDAPSRQDLALARLFTAEMSDRYGLALTVQRVSSAPRSTRVVLMGSVSNPLVRQICDERKLKVTADNPGKEGYVLDVGDRVVLVAGSDDDGAFYGLQSLRQLVQEDEGLSIRPARIRDWPHQHFRGIKIYMPGRENFGFFKRFLRDFMALYKYNTLIMEVNAAMRLDRHPELNTGWTEMAKDLVYSRRDRPEGPHREFQDSTHHDTADGGILEKEEVAGLVAVANEYHIQVVPEIPSLTHSYYLLTNHRELAEIPTAEWPDTYCPSNPKSYDLLFDVLDEYIDVMKPKLIHAGHDEWRMEWGVCPRCRGKDPRELFAQDVIKIHDHLAKKGVRMGIWGDHLLESVRSSTLRKRKSRSGYAYEIPGGLSPDQVKRLIPKDILIFNWFWRDAEKSSIEGEDGTGEHNDITLSNWGFEQVYGNFTPDIENYGRRSARAGVLGGAPSAWLATTEFNFGKDLLYDFTGCASLLWSTHWPNQAELAKIVDEQIPKIRRDLSSRALPSEDGETVAAVKMPSVVASSAGPASDVDLSQMKSGPLHHGRLVFQLPENHAIAPAGDQGIPIGEDVSSLIFLHALARPADNQPGYRYIYNFPDTADLLGWYEVVYEDGFVDTIPVRYGKNILEWSWAKNHSPSTYNFDGDPVNCGTQAANPVTFFAFEWLNPRFGKAIKEVRLKGTSGFTNTRGKIIPDNAILLGALSVTKKRGYPDPVRARTYAGRPVVK